MGGDLFGSKWGVKIDDESAEDTVVLLSQFCDGSDASSME